MKQLTCEMCGSTNLLKQDGMYVCQDCGTKYSVEEAKKLLVEIAGTVDVSGSTVKIDNQEKIENLRALAARAREADDGPTAARYYNELALLSPNDWEAHFYTVFYECYNIKIAQIGNAASRVGSLIDSTFKLINETVDTYAERIAAEATVSTDVVKFSGYLRENAQNFIMKTYTELSAVREEVNELIVPIYEMIILLGDADIKYFKNYDFAIQHYDLVKSAAYILKDTYDGRNLLSIADSRIASAKEMHSKEDKNYRKEYLKEQISELETKIEKTPTDLKELRRGGLRAACILFVVGIAFLGLGLILLFAAKDGALMCLGLVPAGLFLVLGVLVLRSTLINSHKKRTANLKIVEDFKAKLQSFKKELQEISNSSNRDGGAPVTSNLDIEKIILEVLENNGRLTVSGLQSDSRLSEFTNPKLSAILKRLVDNGKVIKETEDFKAYFMIAK